VLRVFVALGALLSFVGVGLGAFGSHGLRSRVDESMLAVWQTAVQYQLVHSLALLFLALLSDRLPSARYAGYLFTAGVLVFSGSLYVYVMTGHRAFALVTPLGGVCFLAGWLALGLSAARSRM
jgi:uncharacterized membrane protein YgdD (TMEM256/DUF423 family)